MYPQLFNQASRLAPMLSRILARGGTFASPLWKESQVDAPGVNAQPMPPAGQPQGPQVPISTSNYAPPPAQPNIPALGGLGLFPPAPSQPSNWLADAQRLPVPRSPTPTLNASPVPAPTQSAATPLPQARPAEAPPTKPDDMSFWQRNAAMMRDPGTGAFIDPTSAAQAVRGPDLINKMMAYLHNKDIG